jgi:sugar phosphate isomerase/epimerase
MAANSPAMNTSIATDYQQGTGSPYRYLEAIAKAGFTHVHWCHQWCTDFLYSTPEITQIKDWLQELGLGVTDIHASAGQEKNWASPLEYERLAGIELVSNRLEMAAQLGCDVAVLHIPLEPEDEPARVAYWDRIRRSLDALLPTIQATGVRIALENGFTPQSWIPITKVCAEYGPEFVGFCYDSGHGNMSGDGLDQLEAHADRLIAVHLHDNNSTNDQHALPFMGTVNWTRLTKLIVASGYNKWVNLELSQQRSGYEDETLFLRDAFNIANRLNEAIATA